ncbi:MAG TPA: type II toxin-antitoxin system PemK/MazF family toxin [Candidatus Sulfotelmatobacter sp.]|nr:type II toxin-antitoxin system PemK/MazF family toxin [Candidatus Sulfotelmatobacter sp.]
MVNYPRRDEVWLIALDPSKGSEIKKTRPCLVVSPDEMNEFLHTTLVAPMTTTLRNYPTRVDLVFRGKAGQIALDQLRAVDRQRLVRKLGAITARAASEVSSVLVEIFVR